MLYHQTVTFPAVTVCNQNRLSCKKLLAEIIRSEALAADTGFPSAEDLAELHELFALAYCGKDGLTCETVVADVTDAFNDTMPVNFYKVNECFDCDEMLGSYFDKAAMCSLGNEQPPAAECQDASGIYESYSSAFFRSQECKDSFAELLESQLDERDLNSTRDAFIQFGENDQLPEHDDLENIRRDFLMRIVDLSFKSDGSNGVDGNGDGNGGNTTLKEGSNETSSTVGESNRTANDSTSITGEHTGNENGSNETSSTTGESDGTEMPNSDSNSSSNNNSSGEQQEEQPASPTSARVFELSNLRAILF